MPAECELLVEVCHRRVLSARLISRAIGSNLPPVSVRWPCGAGADFRWRAAGARAATRRPGPVLGAGTASAPVTGTARPTWHASVGRPAADGREEVLARVFFLVENRPAELFPFGHCRNMADRGTPAGRRAVKFGPALLGDRPVCDVTAGGADGLVIQVGSRAVHTGCPPPTADGIGIYIAGVAWWLAATGPAPGAGELAGRSQGSLNTTVSKLSRLPASADTSGTRSSE